MAWRATEHEVAKRWTRLSDWKTATQKLPYPEESERKVALVLSRGKESLSNRTRN